VKYIYTRCRAFRKFWGNKTCVSIQRKSGKKRIGKKKRKKRSGKTWPRRKKERKKAKVRKSKTNYARAVVETSTNRNLSTSMRVRI